jgi:hypothetical protein
MEGPGTSVASCYRTLDTMDRPLVGGQVQRVAVARLGGREVILLKIRVPPGAPGDLPGENVHVVLAAGIGVGVVDTSGRTQLRDAMQPAAAPAQTRWRARLEAGRVTSVDEWTLAFVREERVWHIGTDQGADLGVTEQAVAAATEGLARETLAARGVRIVDELARAATGGRREALRRALLKAISRLDRRIQAVGGDLARMQSADAAADRARLFVAQAAQAARGATKLEAVDWSSGEERLIEMALDPARHAKEQLDTLFRRARRLKDGAEIARERLSDAETMRAALAAVADALAADPEVDLSALEIRARTAAPRDFRLDSGSTPVRRARMPLPTQRPPYRTFLGVSGARILVGRGAAHNDALSFHVARPHDLWLHAKGDTGAHVVVPLDKGRSCPADVLVEAAHLAAHFSAARDERVVEVQYTPRRYLRKPRGTAPGLVVVDREKVIVLRREDQVLRTLLEREVEQGDDQKGQKIRKG